MGYCVICGNETQNKGDIHVGTPRAEQPDPAHSFAFDDSLYSDYVCAGCINKKLSRDFSGLGLYLFLELLWFKVAQNGFSNIWGILSFLVATAALIRILLVLARKFMQRFFSEKAIPPLLDWGEDREETASALLKQKMLAEFQAEGKRVQTLSEYKSGKKVPR
ncbi:hypothetical protein [Caproiciproducens galactitolivorans]|uniref:Uncharacterized protein n=1 Tax=Caproiciproducens galactitolivorans TaxID=642589 RepID=A0ABT4BTM0_9FIRM|nr:hypothetical protein [Caproiciproducens galactitolivorans]MCY1713680.1 hypothetical protein [Caproiciproducens galactitolivorans]